SINDIHGHLAGDEVLRETARVLEEELLNLRFSDRAMLARYGGEEIAVLLPGVTTSGALRIAECMRVAIETAIITHGGRPIRVTLSAGVATYPTHAANVPSLIAAADAGLYQAKKSGRNQVNCALPELV